MRRRSRRIARLAVLAAAGAAVLGGCNRPKNPWTYAPPPAVSVSAFARPASTGRTVVAVATFGNPDAPQLEWPDVGQEMTNAMRRALYNESDFEVRIAPEVERLVSQPGFLRGAGTVVEPLDVDFVITGKVTDFHHTAALPKDASRWGFFSRKHEAVVAIEWKVVDVRRRRVVAADHTYGTADAGREKSVAELYAGLDVSAYLFWNTPLGRAAHRAVDSTISRMRGLLPARAGQPVITHVAARKVSIEGGWSWGLAEGQEYHLAVRDNDETPPLGVFDADTGRPLLVRIGKVRKDTATGYLMGKPPVDLHGALLLREPVAESLDGLADLRGEGR